MTLVEVGPSARPFHVGLDEVFKHGEQGQYVYDRPSDAEFKRRWQKIQAFMADEGLDVLLIAGGTSVWDRNWTNTRWAVNHVGCQLDHYRYVVFPREGDPTVLSFPLNAIYPARRAREIVEDIRSVWDPSVGVVQLVKEYGQTRGVIGIVEPGTVQEGYRSSAPYTHMDRWREELPGCEFKIVSKLWYRKVRAVRSDEELAFLERSARIGDAMAASIPERIRPGMAEREIFAALYDSMIRAGGETPTMVLAASGSSFAPWDIKQREKHINRNLDRGDIIVVECAPRFADGSETQIGRTYGVGEPSDEYYKMAAFTEKVFADMAEQLRPGKTDLDVLKAGQPVWDAGYIFSGPYYHPPEGNRVVNRRQMKEEDEPPYTFEPNMAFCLEIHVEKPDHSAGIMLVDTWVTTEGAPRRLNKYPTGMIVF